MRFVSVKSVGATGYPSSAPGTSGVGDVPRPQGKKMSHRCWHGGADNRGDLVHRSPELSPKTLKGYQSSRARLDVVFGPCYLDEVSRRDVRHWLHARSARVSANRDLALLRAVYHHAIEWGWCEGNPAASVRRHKETPRRRVTTRAERELLAAHATPLWRALIAVRAADGNAGGGDSNALAGGPHGGGDSSSPTKNGRGIVDRVDISIAGSNRGSAARSQAPFDLCFPIEAGGDRTTENGFRVAWRRLCQRAGVEGLEFRDLRRTAASEAGSLEAARHLLGHGSTAITKRVYRVTNRVKPVA